MSRNLLKSPTQQRWRKWRDPESTSG